MTEPSSEPLLRTLAPALRALERAVRNWLDAPHRHTIPTMTRANLEGLALDLRRKADALELEKPLLTIMLMGGTGVGKSTLLNALAGGPIAQASFQRPTTRDPVAYYHESIQAHRLDPALQHCRLAQHDRNNLEQKILVDTPDLDSNDLSNRDKLLNLLPVADVVLYVGSQEKYHDKLGWDLFLHQRKRRAFAFVLNKWDRCIQTSATGLRPDEDLLRDLQSEGFEKPLLFRTCAAHWVEHAGQNGSTAPPVEGEQFQELLQWLEKGLSRLEIEAIKARGVSQLLHQLLVGLEKAAPPDVSDIAGKARTVWQRTLRQEAASDAEILLNTLEPYQKEIEHHFALRRQGHFSGLMGAYLGMYNKMQYAGSSLRDHIPFVPRIATQTAPPTTWDLQAFTRTCSEAASERQLDARSRALVNRLLVEAKEQGFPIDLLTDATEKVMKLDWRQRYAQSMIEVLSQVEHAWAKPTGWRSWLRGGIVLLGNWVPMLTLLAACAVPLWRYFMQENYQPELSHFLLPLVVLLVVLLCLHLVIAFFMPLRWDAIRGEFQEVLEQRLAGELDRAYSDVPEQVAQHLLEERRQIDQILGEVREVTLWLEQREQAASVAQLYGD